MVGTGGGRAVSLLIAATAGTAPATADDGGAPPAAWVTVGYGPEPFQVLDLVVPDAGAFPGPRPLIVYVHSGGWVAGTRSSVPPETLDQVARGYAVATLDYRLASTDPNGNPVNSFPGAIWDVKRAIRFLKTNAATWNLDARRVVLMGASAGGYLAAFVAATPGAFEPPDLPAVSNPRRDSSVRGVVDLVGPTDLVTFQHTDHPWAAPLTASFLGCLTPNGAHLSRRHPDARVGGPVCGPQRPTHLARLRHRGRPRRPGHPRCPARPCLARRP